MIEISITYEIDKRDGYFVLWRFVEEHDFEKERGYATNQVVFRGTKKECLEEKRRLENERTNTRISSRNRKTSRRNL